MERLAPSASSWTWTAGPAGTWMWLAAPHSPALASTRTMRGAPFRDATVHGHGPADGFGAVLRHRRERLAQLGLEPSHPLDPVAGLGDVGRQAIAKELPEVECGPAPLPRRQQRTDVRDGEAELPEIEGELELLEGRPVVAAVAAFAHRHGVQESLLLVEPDGADGLSRRPRQVSRGEHPLHGRSLMARRSGCNREEVPAAAESTAQPFSTLAAITSRWISLVPS